MGGRDLEAKMRELATLAGIAGPAPPQSYIRDNYGRRCPASRAWTARMFRPRRPAPLRRPLVSAGMAAKVIGADMNARADLIAGPNQWSPVRKSSRQTLGMFLGWLHGKTGGWAR